MPLSEEIARDLASMALASIHREYPNKQGHVLHGDEDVRPPRELTPVFFGAFDWHSAVHSHWSLVRLSKLFPCAPWANEVQGALALSFTSEKVTRELAFLADERRAGFEMPYGMAWLLLLAAELGADPGDRELASYRTILAPLERLAAERFAVWLPSLSHPIRSGEHTSSAFGLGLALDWAAATGDVNLETVARRRALELYERDRDGPIAFEPSAHDFLSPCLTEADLLTRLLPPEAFASWLDSFLPVIDFEPVTPVDRADGKLVHFDGLNLSRAWMLRRIAASLPPANPRLAGLRRQADDHERAGLTGLGGGHYAGSHWLATFALYALAPPKSARP